MPKAISWRKNHGLEECQLLAKCEAAGQTAIRRSKILLVVAHWSVRLAGLVNYVIGQKNVCYILYFLTTI